MVVDDASNNSTAKRVAETYAPCVTYRRNPSNLGLVSNHNHCIASAAGNFIHILHQDDRVELGFYDALLEPMLRDQDLVAAYTNFWLMDETGRQYHRVDLECIRSSPLENWLSRLVHQQCIQFSAIIVRRSAYELVGGFLPSLIYAFDWDMWGRLAASGTIWYDSRALANYRAHKGSATHHIPLSDRLVDELRTVERMLHLLPPHSRRLAAQSALNRLFLHYWYVLSSSPSCIANSAQKRLLNFLLKGWTGEDEKVEVRAALEHFVSR